jgi:hypothetical protein
LMALAQGLLYKVFNRRIGHLEPAVSKNIIILLNNALREN